jgi:hypothetical protein
MLGVFPFWPFAGGRGAGVITRAAAWVKLSNCHLVLTRAGAWHLWVKLSFEKTWVKLSFF